MEKESIKGYVTHIKYRNEKNGYTKDTIQNRKEVSNVRSSYQSK